MKICFTKFFDIYLITRWYDTTIVYKNIYHNLKKNNCVLYDFFSFIRIKYLLFFECIRYTFKWNGNLSDPTYIYIIYKNIFVYIYYLSFGIVIKYFWFKSLLYISRLNAIETTFYNINSYDFILLFHVSRKYLPTRRILFFFRSLLLYFLLIHSW